MIVVKERIKAWLGPIWWYAVVMFCVHRVGDVINIYTGLWLVPQWVPPGELGALLPLGQIGGLLGLPLGILLMPFTKFLNTFGARSEAGKVKALLRDALLLTGVAAVVIAAYTWVAAPLVFERLRIGGAGLIWLLCGIAVTSAFMPVLNNGLQALKLFRWMGVVSLSTAPVRLIFLLPLLPFFGLFGFFSAQFLANVSVIGISFWGLRRVMSPAIRRESYRSHFREMVWYTLPIAVMLVAGSIQTTVQLLVIRQRLPDVESAAFYFGSRFSEIPNILWSAIGVAFFPIVSEAFETGKDTRRILVQVLVFTGIFGSVVSFGLAYTVQWLFGVVERWNAYQPYAHLVLWLAMTNVFRVAFVCFTVHETACRRFRFLAYSAPLSLLEAGALMGLTGYGYFEPYFPASWMEWMRSVQAARLEFIVKLLFCSAVIQFLGLLAHLAWMKPHGPGSRTPPEGDGGACP